METLHTRQWRSGSSCSSQSVHILACPSSRPKNFWWSNNFRSACPFRNQQSSERKVSRGGNLGGKTKKKSSHDGMIDCVVGAVTLVEDSALVAREAIGCVLERVEVAITIESAFSITYTLSYKVAMLETSLFLLESTHPVTGPYWAMSFLSLSSSPFKYSSHALGIFKIGGYRDGSLRWHVWFLFS